MTVIRLCFRQGFERPWRVLVNGKHYASYRQRGGAYQAALRLKRRFAECELVEDGNAQR